MTSVIPEPDDPEARRLRALLSYRILDTPPEPAFNDLVVMASRVCEAPIALVSLIDRDRQWFKARVGINTAETPRKASFCTHILQGPGHIMEIEDALADPRFAALPWVTADPQVRFYAGASLVDHEGHALGVLYRSGNFATVDLAVYLTQLTQQLFRSLASPAASVQLVLDLEPARLEIEQAIPCGLIANELASNSLKHGFPEGRAGEVRVRLRAEDDGHQLRLTVSDTGIGLPPDFDPAHKRSLGLQLVSDLARQLQGHLQIGTGPGAVFEVTFLKTRVRTGDIQRLTPVAKPARETE